MEWKENSARAAGGTSEWDVYHAIFCDMLSFINVIPFYFSEGFHIEWILFQGLFWDFLQTYIQDADMAPVSSISSLS